MTIPGILNFLQSRSQGHQNEWNKKLNLHGHHCGIEIREVVIESEC